MNRKRRSCLMAFVVAVMLFLAAGAQAAPFQSWEWVNPLPQGNDLYGAAYDGSNTFVAVGYGGTIITSTNGTTWTQTNSGTNETLLSVAYGGGVFVAGSEAGIFRSSNGGTSWTKVYQSSSGVVGIAYSAELGKFVAIAYDSNEQTGSILTSSDNGVTWSPTYSAADLGFAILSVTYGKGKFVAGGDSGQILTSTDGINWNLQTLDTFDELHGLTYSPGPPGLFVAVGYAWGDQDVPPSGLIMTSTDGITWNRYLTNSNETVDAVAFGSNTFVAVTDQGTIFNAPSAGDSWTKVNGVTSTYPLYGAVFGKNLFVTAGFQGAIVTSSNGASWTEQEAHGAWASLSAHSQRRWSVAEGAGLLVATDNEESVLVSSDGVAWTLYAQALISSDMIFANDVFVRIGTDGRIMSSSNGSQWTPKATITDSGAPVALDGIAYGEGLFAVTGHVQTGANTYGAVFTSENLTVWTKRWSSTPGDGVLLGKVAYGNDVFVAVVSSGNSGSTLTSTDGIVWNINGGGNLGFAGIAFGNDIFAVYTGAKEIFTSTDGISWAVASIPFVESDFSFSDIKFRNNSFMALGNYGGLVGDIIVNNGEVLSSLDGITWTATTVPTSRRLDAVEYGSGGFVALGEAGTIVRSAATAITYLRLTQGWNFVSFWKLPSVQPSVVIDTVLSQILSNARIIWGYDNASQRWLKHVPNNPDGNNTLVNFDAGKGYWLYYSAESEYTLETTSWTVQPTLVHLEPGWNLVSYSGQDQRTAPAALADAGISGNWSIVWNWLGGGWSAVSATVTTMPVPLLSKFYRNRAYWVKAKGAADWVQ